jgi:hypothetical protein
MAVVTIQKDREPLKYNIDTISSFPSLTRAILSMHFIDSMSWDSQVCSENVSPRIWAMYYTKDMIYIYIYVR